MKIRVFSLLIIIIILSYCGLNNSFAATPSEYADICNKDIYPKATFKKGIDAPFTMKNEISENISTASGELEIKQTDLFLKGRNGLDLSLTRYYSLSTAVRGKPVVSVNDYGSL